MIRKLAFALLLATGTLSGTEGDALHREIRSLKRKIERDEHQVKEQKELIDQLQYYLDELDTFMPDLKNCLEKVCDDVHLHNGQFSKHQFQLQTLEEQLGRLEALTSRLDQKCASTLDYLQKQITSLRYQEWESCRTHSSPTDQIMEMQEHLCYLQNQVNCLEEELCNLGTPPPSCCYPSPGPFFWRVGGEFLYWTIYESQLDYVIDGGPANIVGVTSLGAIGQLRSAEYCWRPGFRVYADYPFCPDEWTLRGQYTFFYCSGSDAVTQPAPELLNGTFNQTTSPIGRASTDISFHYHIGELLLSRSFCVSPCLTGRLQVGGLGGYIEQDWAILYFQLGSNRFEVTNSDWSFAGGGLKLGTAFDWNLYKGLGLQAEANWGSLIGWYKNRLFQETIEDGALVGISSNSRNNQGRYAQTFQIKLGPSWAYCCRCLGGRIYALYEFNGWIGLHQVDRSFISDTANAGRDSRHVEGTVGLHGLTLGCEFAF